jgi:hypothetical protein
VARSAQRSRGFMCVPSFTVAPSITGQAKNGQTLTGVSGTIANGALSSRRWLRDGVAISGATGATYVVQAADIGHLITFEVTATASLVAANTKVATSAPTATVIA